MVRAICLLIALASITTHAGYVDADGNELAQFRPVEQKLAEFYGEAMPPVIRVAVKDFGDGSSRFDCRSNTVWLHPRALEVDGVGFVSHESSHLALCRLSRGANLMTEFRFWDEGLANILQHRVKGTEESYKQKALRLAAEQLSQGNVSFEKVMAWRDYTGATSGDYNSYAYEVGSSFDYYLIDTFSEGKLREFLIKIGESRSLDQALIEAFGKTRPEIEAGWLSYVRTGK